MLAEASDLPEASGKVFHVCLSVETEDQRDRVSEVFSLPRVVPLAETYGFRQSMSYDLGNGLDFRKA